MKDETEINKALIVQQLVRRYHEMRRIGHHKGAILASMVQEGHAAGAIEEVRKAVADGA